MSPMNFKTLPPLAESRIAARPIDYEWDVTLGNGFLAATEEDSPRLWDALSLLNIQGAADLALGAAEWCLARTQAHVDPEDGRMRLQAAWAATVDPRFAALRDAAKLADSLASPWSRPERLARRMLFSLCDDLSTRHTNSVRQTALGMNLLAEHLCGRDPDFGPWLTRLLGLKVASSPRHPADLDHGYRESVLPAPQELTAPSRDERLAGLDPGMNPYLRSAAEMAAQGFVGHPYAGHA